MSIDVGLAIALVSAVVAVAVFMFDARTKMSELKDGLKDLSKYQVAAMAERNTMKGDLDELVKIHRARPVDSVLDEHARLIGEMHQEHTRVLSNLAGAINELSHYIRWLGQEQTGKQPPPPVRELVKGK